MTDAHARSSTKPSFEERIYDICSRFGGDFTSGDVYDKMRAEYREHPTAVQIAGILHRRHYVQKVGVKNETNGYSFDSSTRKKVVYRFRRGVDIHAK
jgi:hypothetical protein